VLAQGVLRVLSLSLRDLRVRSSARWTCTPLRDRASHVFGTSLALWGGIGRSGSGEH